MGRHVLRRLLPVALALFITLAGAGSVEAAAPRVIMISSPSLTQPVVMTDWWENLDLMLGFGEEAANVTPDELAARPSFHLALFWGQSWVDDAGKPRLGLRPEQANQQAWFYPAVGDAEAIVRFEYIPGPGPLIRRVEPKGLEMLARHGVPIRLEPGTPSSSTSPATAPGQSWSAEARMEPPVLLRPSMVSIMVALSA